MLSQQSPPNCNSHCKHPPTSPIAPAQTTKRFFTCSPWCEWCWWGWIAIRVKLSLGVWSGLLPLPPGGDTCSTLGGRCEIVEPERHKAWRTVIILIFLCYLEIFFTTGRENQYRNHVLEVVKKIHKITCQLYYLLLKF